MREGSVNCGFTLIEILVALVILAITVSVVLEAQITSLKIEQKARSLQLFRFETERIFSTTHRVKNEEELTRLLETNNLCRIKSEKVKIESGTNVLILIKHEMNTDLSAIVPSVKRLGATAEALPSSSLRSQRLCYGEVGLYYGGVGFSSVFYTRIPDYPSQRPDAGGIPVDPPGRVDGQKSVAVP